MKRPQTAVHARRTRNSRLSRAVSLSLESLETRRLMTAYVVSSSADGGAGSLREAISLANTSPGHDTITFTSGVTKIAVADVLLVSDEVTIDGSGGTGSPQVWIDGSADGTFDGLQVDAANSTIKGLALTGFMNGIVLNGAGNTVAGNYLGITLSGPQANKYGMGDAGILVTGDNNRIVGNQSVRSVSGVRVDGATGTVIGGTTAADMNVLSLNGYGVEVVSATGTRILGNHMGVDATGNLSMANDSNGVVVYGGATDTTISGNIISGNGATEIDVWNATGTSILNNVIGLTADGHVPLKGTVELTGSEGIVITGDPAVPTNTTISGNLISGNGSQGVRLVGASYVTVIKNRIGTNAAGAAATGLGNRGGGVGLQDGAHHNTVGGVGGAGNVIVGSGDNGITLIDAADNTIAANSIGALADGSGSFAGTGNNGDGIQILGTSVDNVITGNTIAYSHGIGVSVYDGQRNAIRGNAMYGNRDLGIDLVEDSGTTRGVALNDPARVHVGPNLFQSYPEIGSVTHAGGNLVITGTLLNGTAAHQVDLFASVDPHATGFGEGQKYLGTVSVNADGTFTATVPVGTEFRYLTATATDAAGNTSEFSPVKAIPAAAPVDQFTATDLTSSSPVSTIGDKVTFTATISNTSTPGLKPTGSVVFREGTRVLGTVALVDGIAVLDASDLTIGTSTITAEYLGEGDFKPSSDNVQQQVQRDDTTTTVTSGGGVREAESVTFLVTVTAHSPRSGIPGGTVNLYDGTTLLATLTLDAGGQASFTTSLLGVGPHAIRADYVHDVHHNDSTDTYTQAVNKDDTAVTLTTSGSVVVGNPVTFTASVTDLFSGGTRPDGGTVTFFRAGGTVLGSGTVANGTVTLTVSDLAVGSHTVYAVYADNAALVGSTSNNVTVAVSPAATTTTVWSSNPSSTYGDPVTFTAQVTSAYAGLALTGTVTFKAGNTVLGVVNVANGTASLTTSSLAAGSYTITAEYSGDTVFTGSGATTTQTVVAASTATSVTSSANPSNAGQSVTFTATVSSPAGVPTGTVTFKAGSTVLGTVTLVNGVASIATSALAVGSYVVTADYAGDANFTASTGSVDQTVKSTAYVTSGRTLRDVTGNGLSADDVVLPGVTVKLFKDANNNGILDSADGAAVATMVTGATGVYSFTIAGAGRYFTQEAVPAGYVLTAPSIGNYYSFTAVTGGSSANDFDNYRSCDGCDVTNVYYAINGTQVVTDLRGAVHQGDVVSVTFTVPAGHSPEVLSLVSYTAPDSVFSAGNASQQKVWELQSGTFGPGTYTMTVTVPDTYFQVDFVCGYAIDQFGPSGSNIFYGAQSRLISADNGGTRLYVPGTSSLSGFVYNDANNDGVKDSAEAGISGVTVFLKNGSGATVQTVTTDANGRYAFANVAPGVYSVVETQPAGYLDGKDTVGTAGGTAGNDVFSNVTISNTPQSEKGYNFGEQKAATSSLSGYVYIDKDNDGLRESGEAGINCVVLKLKNAAGQVVATTTTNSAGYYIFNNVTPGTYTLEEAQPADYVDGLENAGSLGGDDSGDNNLITAIPVGAGQNGINYNFGELPEICVREGDTATIGFWQNKNGQALINSLNGGPTSKLLANWLSTSFPNVYGAGKPNSLVNKTNADVAAMFKRLFNVTGQKLDAQFMGVALAVYSTTKSLGGTTASKYGFTVSDLGTGNHVYNVKTNGAAFGVANNTDVAVMDLLTYADSKAVNGVLYNGNTTLRNMANNVFDGINNQGDI